MNILVVDDAPDIRAYLKLLLEHWGYQVTLAANGMEAIEALRRKRIQLVVSDWMMPYMSGIELFSKIRAMDMKYYMHLIMFSGRLEEDDIEASLAAGADFFLDKPINKPTLHSALKDAAMIIKNENIHRLTNKNVQKQSAQTVLIKAAGEPDMALNLLAEAKQRKKKMKDLLAQVTFQN